MIEKNLPNAIRPLLKRAGLDAREIEIYLTILSLKIAPASRIAKEARQERSNTYLILHSLQEKGLISEVERGKVRHFVAEDPNRLLVHIEEQEKEMQQIHTLLGDALPILRSITKSITDQPRVTLSRGFDAMKQSYREILSQEFVGAFNLEKVYGTFGKTVAESIFGKAAELKGREFVINNEAGREYFEKQNSPHLESRLFPKDILFDSDILIFRDTVVFFAYDDEKTVVRIENQNIADLLTSWFEMLWSTMK
jgi:sugar-specific transcriptional regulator TrmB